MRAAPAAARGSRVESSNGGEATTRADSIILRIAGAVCAVASAAGACLVIAKLYTGRGSATPIHAAVYEQPLVALAGLAGIALGVYIALCPREIIAARRWMNLLWVWRERRAEAALLAMSTLLAVGLLEAGSRALYARDEKFPFFFPPEHLVYPALYHAMKDYSPNTKNVLLLGGSVLSWSVGDGSLQRELGPGWRVYNLAAPAHSSLDSLTKYRYLLDRGYRFDYIVFYHAINDVRANNAPPDVFRADYSHYLYYRLVHAVFEDNRPFWRAALHSALIFRADRLIAQLRETRAFGRNFVNISYPREDWLKYGSDIKSAASFEANLLAVADLATAHGARLLVGEFVYDPRLDAYVQGSAGAPSRESMITLTKEWGLPENVQKGIVAHNEAIRRHSDRYLYLPTAQLKRTEYLLDSCHFTPEGQVLFVHCLANALR